MPDGAAAAPGINPGPPPHNACVPVIRTPPNSTRDSSLDMTSMRLRRARASPGRRRTPWARAWPLILCWRTFSRRQEPPGLLADLFGFPQKLELPLRGIRGDFKCLPRQSCSWIAKCVRQPLGLRPRTPNAVSAATGQPLTGYTISKCASVGWPVFPLIGRMSCGQADMATMQSVSARRST